jgi:hypothetical protein
MLADLGFNTYRFSIEWARIEPDEGFFSNAELDHYRRMLATCHEHHLTTLLTYSHFSVPRWFAYKGGWQNPAAPDRFARYCERVTKHLGDLVDFASTFNEPSVQLLNWISRHRGRASEMLQGGLSKARPAFAPCCRPASVMAKIRDGVLAPMPAKGGQSPRAVWPVISPCLTISPRRPTASEKRADVCGPWLKQTTFSACKLFAGHCRQERPPRRRTHAVG